MQRVPTTPVREFVARVGAGLLLGLLFVVAAPRAMAQDRELSWHPPEAKEQLQYEVWELTLQVGRPVIANPFWDGEVLADFRAPSGASLHVEGFADAMDGSVYRLRFAPWEVGTYRVNLVYQERDPVTRAVTHQEGYQTGFRVTSAAAPGPLVARDPRFVHSFRNVKTGRFFYPLPYNAPSLFHATAERVNEFIGYVDEAGYDSVRFQLLAGSRPLHIPAGQEINPFVRRTDGIIDFRRYNLSIWRRVDALMRDLGRRDMAAHLIALIEWGCLVEGGDKSEGGTRCDDAAPRLMAGSAEEQKYFKDILNRYAAFPNFSSLILGNELNEYRDERWADATATLIKSHSPYPNHPMVSVHPSDMGSLDGSRGFYYLYYQDWWWRKPWCDAPSIQIYPFQKTPGRQDDFDTLGDFARWHRANVALPMTNDESGWEQREGDLWDSETVRKTFWTNTLSGLYGAYGSIISITRGRSARDSALLDPFNQLGFHQIAASAPFFKNSTYHWLLEPDQDRVTGYANERGHKPHVRSVPGIEYVAYLPSGGGVSLDLGEAAAGVDLPVEWVNPLDGLRFPAGNTYGLTTLDLASPFSSPDFPHDAILHVGGPVREGSPYQADFDSAARPWGFVPQTGQWRFVRGVYAQMRRPIADPPYATTLGTRYPKNFIAQFDVRFAPGETGFAGLQFRKGRPGDGPADSGYTLAIYPNGLVAFGKGVAGAYTSFGETTAATFDPSAANRVWVSAIGDRFEIRVNGVLVTRFRDLERSHGEGFFGLIAQQRAAFDDVVLQPILNDDFSDNAAESFTVPTGRFQAARGRLWGIGPEAELRADGWLFQTLWMSFDATLPEGGTVEARFRVRRPDDLDTVSGYSVDVEPARVALYAAGGDRRRLVLEAPLEPGDPKIPVPVRVEARGTRLKVFVRDTLVIDAVDGQWLRGHVALVAKKTAAPVSVDNVLAVEITDLTTPAR